MRRCVRTFVLAGLVALLAAVGLSTPGGARAHCDTLDGPVVEDARRALEAGDIAPVLKWIPAAHEADVREAFTSASAVRRQGGPARELADRFFFETLVRIHRAGEGASYQGLKPAGAVPPDIAAADRALASGSVEKLAGDLSAAVAEEVRRRFEIALRLKAHAEESPGAGRDFVAAYVDYVHFVEGLHHVVQGGESGHESHDPADAHRP